MHLNDSASPAEPARASGREELVDRIAVRPPVSHDFVQRHLLEHDRRQRLPLALGEVVVDGVPDGRPGFGPLGRSVRIDLGTEIE
jgi:hypothetical protein